MLHIQLMKRNSLVFGMTHLACGYEDEAAGYGDY